MENKRDRGREGGRGWCITPSWHSFTCGPTDVQCAKYTITPPPHPPFAFLSFPSPSLSCPPADAGKKRLDLAGALLAGLFRQLFRKLTQNVRKYLQLCLDKGTPFVVGTAIKSQVRFGAAVHVG